MRPNRLLLLTVALAGVATVSLLAAFVIGIHPFAEARWGFHTPARICSELVTDGQIRGAVAGGLTLTVILLHVSLAARAWRRSARKVRDLTAVLEALPSVEPSGHLRRILALSGTQAHTTVVDSADVFAFTAGQREPRIYLSRGAVERLEADELEAVIRHEEHHRRAGDPLRAQALIALRAALGYLPATRRLVRAYLREAEFAADDAALRTVPARTLLSAFLKLAEASPPAAAVAAYTDFAEARVGRLSLRGHQYGTEWAGLLASFTASLLLLVSLPLVSLALTELHPISLLLP